MQLDQAPLGLHGRLLHVLDHLHRVRVAHGHQRNLTREDLAGRRLQRQRPQHGLPLLPGHQTPCGERQPARIERGLAHVHFHPAVRHQPGRDDAATRQHADPVTVGQPLLVHEAHEAARAVAALLHLDAVGIDDPVDKIQPLGPGCGHLFCRGTLDDQDLVGPHAHMAIGQPAPLRQRHRRHATGGIDHHEIVAGTVHLRESQLHAVLPSVAGPLSSSGTSSISVSGMG